MRTLSAEEIKRILQDTWHGVLALIDEDKPYCFPTAHIFYMGSLYFLFLKYGRKVKCIERNPNACYLVFELTEDKWFSVIAEGHMARVKEPSEMRPVLELFYSKVFPRDPYFRELRGKPEVVDKLIREIAESHIPGLYRLEIVRLSGLASP